MFLRALEISLILVSSMLCVACGSSRPPSQDPVVEPLPTRVADDKGIVGTEEATTVQATEIATSIPPRPTKVMPSPTAVIKATQAEQIEITPVATPTIEAASPTVSVPTATVATKEVSFIAATEYDSFSTEQQDAFREIVDAEFDAAKEKASISVAVYGGNRLWTYATGEADTGKDITVDTPILIGSTSKTFVSALVLHQIEKGHYGLDDALETVLVDHPDYPSFDQTKVNAAVTVREMLSMTSGLADFNENFKGKAGLFSAQEWKPADNINLLQSGYSSPGNFKYVDTNLVLLGLIAEKYGENDLYGLYNQEFLKPLGISAVFLTESTTPENTARPYDDISNYGGSFGNLIDAAPYSFGHYSKGQGRIRWACCGLISTAENMARWGYELYSDNGKALSPDNRNILIQSLSDNQVNFQGNMQNYGYFIAKRVFALANGTEITAYGHPGGGGGYSSLLRYSPELDISVSVLANSTLSFQGHCGEYAPRTCTAIGIFEAYSQ